MKLSLITITASILLLSAHLHSAPTLNDAQITKVIMTVDEGEAELGKMAKGTTNNPAVKKFADHMVMDHTESQMKFTTLAKKISVTPQDSEKSTSMKNDGIATKTKLTGLRGAEFDKSYIDSMVTAHQKVLDGLDKDLIPSAKNDELKAALQKKRNTVSDHLKHAKEVQATL